MKGQNPKISVIMPVYNGEKHLVEAINSILTQTFTDFEFIIINDASTDSTAQIINDFAKKDSRIRILTNKINLKIAA
ncbi:MAG: glycosyltransferase, partial [Gammaproteobacteria bacterium]|nr:glycosyltransferase [Gammaproteobacteria bacterium]